MIWLVAIVFVGCALAAAYAMFLRPMWMQYAFFQKFVAAADGKALTWFQVLRIGFHGWLSKFVGRFCQFASVVVGFNDSAISPVAQSFGGVDWVQWLPEKYRIVVPAIFFGFGTLINFLRQFADTAVPTTVAGQVENVVAAAIKVNAPIAPNIKAIPMPDIKAAQAIAAGEMKAAA